MALEVEAALIDAYSDLSNCQSGHGSNEKGAMTAKEVIQRFAAEQAHLEHKLLLLSVTNSIKDLSPYDAARFAWRLSLEKVKNVEFVLAVDRGIIVDVFVPEEWLEASRTNFPILGKVEKTSLIGFRGKEAPNDIKQQYIGKRIPQGYNFSQNGVRYSI